MNHAVYTTQFIHPNGQRQPVITEGTCKQNLLLQLYFLYYKLIKLYYLHLKVIISQQLFFQVLRVLNTFDPYRPIKIYYMSSLQADNVETRRRRSQSKFNKDLPRYQCYCSKQYLSYPALYLHMKNKHLEYFQISKNGKKTEATKLTETYDQNEGFKVYKILTDNADNEKKEGGNDRMEAAYGSNPACLPPFYQNYSLPMNYPSNYDFMNYPPQSARAEKKVANRQSVIEASLYSFMNSISNKHAKQRYQIELFFILLVDCVNKYPQIVNDPRLTKETTRYTSKYNCDFLKNALPYFQSVYIPSLIEEEDKPYTFFLENSHIISTSHYKRVFEDFLDFIYQRHPLPQYEVKKVVEPHQDSEQYLESGEEVSQSQGGQNHSEEEKINNS